jgi:hypothetical protein
MGVQALIERLMCKVADTPEPPLRCSRGTGEPASALACTPDTPDTSELRRGELQPPDDDTCAIPLVIAAMRACDLHGDGSAAREDMRLACLSTPAHLQQDLLEHFRQAYGESVYHLQHLGRTR